MSLATRDGRRPKASHFMMMAPMTSRRDQGDFGGGKPIAACLWVSTASEPRSVGLEGSEWLVPGAEFRTANVGEGSQLPVRVLRKRSPARQTALASDLRPLHLERRPFVAAPITGADGRLVAVSVSKPTEDQCRQPLSDSKRGTPSSFLPWAPVSTQLEEAITGAPGTERTKLRAERPKLSGSAPNELTSNDGLFKTDQYLQRR